MSNRVSVQYTKFETLTDDGKVTYSSFGYRIYDDYDYGKVYQNYYQTFEALKEEVNKDTLLDVIKSYPEFSDIDSDTCSGVFFNDEYYALDDL